jgi:hypothetical protein
MSEENRILPAELDHSKADRRNGDNILAIRDFHYHGNDLRELKEIAKENPDLAHKLVDNSDRQDARANVSYRFGLIATSAIVIAVIGLFGIIIFTEGLKATLAYGFILFLCIILIRVILTGEWSDESWIGRALVWMSKLLGANSGS